MKVAFIKIDAEKNRDVSDMYNVNALPTFLFLKAGVQVEKSIKAHDKSRQQD